MENRQRLVKVLSIFERAFRTRNISSPCRTKIGMCYLQSVLESSQHTSSIHGNLLLMYIADFVVAAVAFLVVIGGDRWWWR